jgi:hypothetical protein
MDQSQDAQPTEQMETNTINARPVAPVVQQSVASHSADRQNSTFDKLRHVTAWVMIASAITFALVGILATWEVFGPNTGDVIWRSFSSLAIIAFAALIVNVAARMAESKL